MPPLTQSLCQLAKSSAPSTTLDGELYLLTLPLPPPIPSSCIHPAQPSAIMLIVFMAWLLLVAAWTLGILMDSTN